MTYQGKPPLSAKIQCSVHKDRCCDPVLGDFPQTEDLQGSIATDYLHLNIQIDFYNTFWLCGCDTLAFHSAAGPSVVPPVGGVNACTVLVPWTDTGDVKDFFKPKLEIIIMSPGNAGTLAVKTLYLPCGTSDYLNEAVTWHDQLTFALNGIFDCSEPQDYIVALNLSNICPGEKPTTASYCAISNASDGVSLNGSDCITPWLGAQFPGGGTPPSSCFSNGVFHPVTVGPGDIPPFAGIGDDGTGDNHCGNLPGQADRDAECISGVGFGCYSGSNTGISYGIESRLGPPTGHVNHLFGGAAATGSGGMGLNFFNSIPFKFKKSDGTSQVWRKGEGVFRLGKWFANCYNIINGNCDPYNTGVTPPGGGIPTGTGA